MQTGRHFVINEKGTDISSGIAISADPPDIGNMFLPCANFATAWNLTNQEIPSHEWQEGTKDNIERAQLNGTRWYLVLLN